MKEEARAWDANKTKQKMPGFKMTSRYMGLMFRVFGSIFRVFLICVRFRSVFLPVLVGIVVILSGMWSRNQTESTNICANTMDYTILYPPLLSSPLHMDLASLEHNC